MTNTGRAPDDSGATTALLGPVDGVVRPSAGVVQAADGPVAFAPPLIVSLDRSRGADRLETERHEGLAAIPLDGLRGERVLFFGKRMSRSRCTGALVDALRDNGLDVRWRNFATLRRWVGRRAARSCLRAEFRRYRPDLVFSFCMDLPRELIAEFRPAARIVLWVEEPWLDCSPRQLDYMRQADLVCLSNPTLVPLLRSHGVENVTFQMSGFSPRFHFPLAGSRERRDLAFIGGPGQGDRRAEFLLQLADSCDVDVFGVGWERFVDAHPRLHINRPIGNRGFRRVCAESRIVLGMNQVDADPLYFSNRIWLTLACRGFHLTRFVPGMDQIFRRGEHLDWFESLDEAVERVRHYLAVPDERRRIAAAGHEFAVAGHQYRDRVRRVLVEVESIRRRDFDPQRDPARVGTAIRTGEPPPAPRSRIVQSS